MMSKKVCIYCASSQNIPQKYFDQTIELTTLLVKSGFHLVYGGGASGLMGSVADTCLSLNGKITGVIPKFMKKVEWDHPQVKDMITVDTMTERKSKFLEISDIIIALPGGVGTLEELSEILSNKRLGLNHQEVIIANFDGFYKALIQFLNQMYTEHFLSQESKKLWVDFDRPGEIIQYLLKKT